MPPQPKELLAPDAALANASSVEVARVWVVDGTPHVTLRVAVWDDPAAWGMLLVDLARHIARGYAQSTNRDESGTLKRLREGFDAEWASPTDTPTGRVRGREA